MAEREARKANGASRLDFRHLKRLVSFGLPYVHLAVLAFVLILVFTAASLAGPIIIKIAIDDCLVEKDLDALTQMVLLFFGVMVVEFLARFWQATSTGMLGQKVMFDLRATIFSRLQELPIAYFDRNPVGRIITRVTNDVENLNQLFTQGIVSIFADIFIILGIVGVMVATAPALALWSFLVLPFLVVATFVFRRKVRDAFEVTRRLLARINANMQENITGMKTVQLFRREAGSFERFARINRKHTDAQERTVNYFAVFFPLVDVLSAAALALVVFKGGEAIGAGALTYGTVFAFVRYLEMFFRPVSDLAEKYNVLQQAMVSSERIFKLLDEKPEMPAASYVAANGGAAGSVPHVGSGRPASGTAPHVGSGQPASQTPPHVGRGAGPAPASVAPERAFRGPVESVRFENVVFGYDPAVPVIRDISFSVERGQTAALVGHTGAGKSTLINLLSRFYEIQSGQILINGEDIRSFSSPSLRRSLVAVLQDPFIFSRSVTENIRLGGDGIGAGEVRKAAQLVNAHGFIEALPGGYETVLVERGEDLSTGQKQLLSFARAMAWDPDLLILDEATANIDTATEALIQSAIAELTRRRTSIIIAHRLSTIQNAEKIIVLHHGRKVEEGTHAELLAVRGLYYRLYQLQHKEERIRKALK